MAGSLTNDDFRKMLERRKAGDATAKVCAGTLLVHWCTSSSHLRWGISPRSSRAIVPTPLLFVTRRRRPMRPTGHSMHDIDEHKHI